ncbi:chemotaxis response regulator protein-glutamate methylesterase [Aeoliella sp. ICT_H6.2]|uniref:Protein-glutamate methylesterase/protein-glutamine glutaminase n=1 Tax=Aeoliella straminimaris TaxID=2954799 RepID=A0A9X2FDK1_9BACT|nr:chemotaxis response regulator protein-glutamate methylesterase [Aeoliella straminimaris]MCO6043911.1 chemotaxis response regulator protein-glutamate methylesterase [Aeoliella straminimaris]
MPIKVLIVDDSALIRQILSDILGSDPDIEVVGVASDPLVARDKVKALHPDVLTLDVEMPRMDGLTFLEKLMRARPTPVLMVSSLTERNCDTTLKALELGAVDFVTKPKLDVHDGTFDLAEEIRTKVKACAQARFQDKRNRPNVTRPRPASSGPGGASALIKSTNQVICIGASTGGTEALHDVLTSLPADSPGTLIVQHMPPGFTRAFAKRLDNACQISVKEAEDGDRVLPGHALLAPGGLHMGVYRSGANYAVKVGHGEPVNRHRPSVDVLFRSAAKHLGSNAIGVILTGMGNDGAAGMLQMHQAGARTMAQDESTCVVFGMPKEAITAGGVDEVVPLDCVAERMLALAAGQLPRTATSPAT